MIYKKIILFTLCLILGRSPLSGAAEQTKEIHEVKKNLKFIAAGGIGIPLSIFLAMGITSGAGWSTMYYFEPAFHRNGIHRSDILRMMAVTIFGALFCGAAAGISTHLTRKTIEDVLKADQEESVFQSDDDKPLSESRANWEFIKGCIATGLIPLSLIAIFIESASVIRRRVDPYFTCIGLASPFICWYSAKWAREKFNKSLMAKKLKPLPLSNNEKVIDGASQTAPQSLEMDEHI